MVKINIHGKLFSNFVDREKADFDGQRALRDQCNLATISQASHVFLITAFQMCKEHYNCQITKQLLCINNNIILEEVTMLL